MNLEQRLKDSFEDPGVRSLSDDILSEVRTNWREAESSLRRTFALILLLSLVFELLSRGGIGELNLQFVKLSNPEIVRVGIPLVIAYLWSVVATLITETTFFASIQRAILNLTHPELTKNDLEPILYPANSLIYSSGRFVSLQSGERSDKLLAVFFLPRFFLLALAPIAFDIYAYIVLFQNLGPTNIFLLISCMVAIVLVAESVALFIVRAQSL
jgi:hypothetical protein